MSRGRPSPEVGKGVQSRPQPLHPRKIRRRWLWRTFLFGFALGLFWAGWKQAVADVAYIRELFGF